MSDLALLLKARGEVSEASEWTGRAVERYRQLADAGNLDAIRELIDIFEEEGHGDYALVWLRRAVELGDLEAQSKLAQWQPGK